MASSGIFGQFDEAMEKFRRDDDEFTLFFNAVGLWLNREIDKVNSNSSAKSIEGVRKRALVGKAGVRKLIAEPTFELTTDGGRAGAVRLSLLTSAIEADIEDPGNPFGDRDRSAKFRLKNSLDGGKAFRIEKENDNLNETGLKPEDVAKIVVEAVVRGNFV